MDLTLAIMKALDGEALLFVGAGFSLGAINLQGKPFRRGVEFARHLAQGSGLPPESSLEDSAEAFAQTHGEDRLIRELQNDFTAKTVALFHRGIAAVPWKRIYTTNYDNVLETAFRLEGKRLTAVTLSEDIYSIPKDDTACIHFNGFVDTLDRQKLWTELKLTESSYITASIAETSWAMLFRQDLKLAKAVFFVGYSLYDLDIKRIINESVLMKDKSFFYLGHSPPQDARRRASRFGTVIDASAEDFVAAVRHVAGKYTPTKDPALSLLSVREHSLPAPTSRVSDRAVLDLLELGKVSSDLIVESLRSGQKYFLERSSTQGVFEAIDRGQRVFVVCSDLGNGKTMFLEGLRIRALEQGYRVFSVEADSRGTDAEIEMVAKLGGNVLLTIDGYQDWLDEIRLFCTSASDRAVLVLAARNAVHDVLLDELTELAGLEFVPEIPLDILDLREKQWLSETLNTYGLWGELAGRKPRQKIRFLSEECRGQWHAVLLKLLDSPDIGKRLRAVGKRLSEKGANYLELLSVFILTVLNHIPTMDVLVDIWGTDRLGGTRFRRDPLIKELLDFSSGAVQVRSPVAGEYLIRNSADAPSLVSVLITMAERVAEGARFDRRYTSMFRSLVRFSSLQLLLPEEGRRNAVIRYYEAIKNLYGCKDHPLFWLQYAIASLVTNELTRAKRYFDTAYSLARSHGWDTFHIDNHFARFLLVQAVQELPVTEALENFRLAKSIINRQIRRERMHYPYRVAISYADFVDRFGTLFSPPQTEEISEAARTVLEKIKVLPEGRRQHRNVRECERSMEYVLTRCKELATAVRD